MLPLRRTVAAQAPDEAGGESVRQRLGDGHRDAAVPGVRRWTVLAFAVAALAVPGFTVAMTMVSESASQPVPSVTWSRGEVPIGVSQESSAGPADTPAATPGQRSASPAGPRPGRSAETQPTGAPADDRTDDRTDDQADDQADDWADDWADDERRDGERGGGDDDGRH
ncbi:hypothetical protein [Nonomuraea sp. NPDC003709]|uniref:hypothetical protein n=1 Tax=Nonomuraea sp. NPDC003709 TaxID=3154450 RepID=UPI0033ADFC47